MKRSTRITCWVAPVLVVVVAAALYVVWPHWVQDPEAEVARLMELLELQPGMTAAEIGAGSGEITVILAQRLGEGGHVFSTELTLGRLRAIREAVTKAGLENVSVIQAGEKETNLAAGCCDAIFMRKVYHHLTDPHATNASLFQSLRAGGRVAIIDFRPRFWLFFLPKPDGVSENRGGHGISPAVVIEELEQAGFQLEHRIGAWPVRNYCLVFRKPPSP